MTPTRPILPLFLDEGAPKGVGDFFSERGHAVTFMQTVMPTASPDTLVSEMALRNDAILVAVDKDMRRIASRYGIGSTRFKRLHLLQFRCTAPQSLYRLREAYSLIEAEWVIAQKKQARRFWVEVWESFIKTHR